MKVLKSKHLNPEIIPNPFLLVSFALASLNLTSCNPGDNKNPDTPITESSKSRETLAKIEPPLAQKSDLGAAIIKRTLSQIREVPVCWSQEIVDNESESFSTASRSIIKSNVLSAFPSAITQINFTGWNDCKPLNLPFVFGNEKMQVVLRRQPLKDTDGVTAFRKIDANGKPIETSPTDTIGSFGFFDLKFIPDAKFMTKSVSDLKEKVLANVYLGDRGVKNNSLLKVSVDQVLAMTTIHEFGHILGLTHEHAHPDAAKDPNCGMPYSGYTNTEPFGLNADEDISKRYYSANSVMNYCYLNLRKFESPGSFKLSPRDQLNLVSQAILLRKAFDSLATKNGK